MYTPKYHARCLWYKPGVKVCVQLLTAFSSRVPLTRPHVDADVVDLQRGSNGANPTVHAESEDWSTWLSQNLAWCSII